MSIKHSKCLLCITFADAFLPSLRQSALEIYSKRYLLLSEDSRRPRYRSLRLSMLY
jgi:hypothetical protein